MHQEKEHTIFAVSHKFEPITDDKIKLVEPTKRRQDANIFSRWTFSYYNDLAKRGTKKQLMPEDFPKIEEIDECEQLASDITNEFQIQKKLGRGLWWVLFKVFGRSYFLSGIFIFLESVCQLGLGYCLGNLLRWFEDPNRDLSSGYYYAIGISIFSIFNGWFHVSLFVAMRTGMRIRVGLIATIYRKCLSLSLSNSLSSGFIVNMVSNDVQRFEDASPFGNFLWVGPIQFVIAMYLIYREIGWVFLAPCLSLLLMAPIQGSFGALFGKYRKNAVFHRDDKIKNISDMLSGIMIVKLYAWEKPFINTINAMRNLEMKWIWKGNRLKAINESIFFSSGGYFMLI
jgi:ATP-binding cassette subfamily C (CFTR/MRP) protein 4